MIIPHIFTFTNLNVYLKCIIYYWNWNKKYMSGFCHFGLVLFMVLWQSPDTPIMSAFSCERAASSVLESRALSSACLVSCWSVVFGCRLSVIVWVRGLEFARHRALLSTCVLLCCTQFVFLSAACIYVISCAVWHAVCIFIGCVLSCCHVLCEHMAYEFSH